MSRRAHLARPHRGCLPAVNSSLDLPLLHRSHSPLFSLASPDWAVTGRCCFNSNGRGTDHGWGGNALVMGGSVNGSQIFGTYPSSLGDDSDVGVGRGTLVPGTSWEALWNGVGEWLGVPPDQMSTVLPNRDNFAANQLITQSELFVEPIPLTSSPTPSPSPSPTSSPSPPPPPPTPPPTTPRCGDGVGDWNLVFRQTAGTYLSPVS